MTATVAGHFVEHVDWCCAAAGSVFVSGFETPANSSFDSRLSCHLFCAEFCAAFSLVTEHLSNRKALPSKLDLMLCGSYIQACWLWVAGVPMLFGMMRLCPEPGLRPFFKGPGQ
jgi:hypothetical protein